MKTMTALMLAVVALAGCREKVFCGPGTIAVPVGVDTSAPGYQMKFEGNEYVDADGHEYKEIQCQAATSVVTCGANLVLRPASAGEMAHTDGSGYYVKHDGGGLFVKHDDSVQADKVCALGEPAPDETAPDETAPANPPQGNTASP
jgi:hypothetical protein